MKKCARCKDDVSHDDFYKDPRTPDGLYSSCKFCYQRRRRGRDQRAPNTMEGFYKRTWQYISHRGNKGCYKGIEVRITREAFLEFCEGSNLHDLYSTWIASGKEYRLTPSIDRIDPDGHYEILNIQWLPLHINCGRARHTNADKRRSVTQRTKDGTFVETFNSITEAGVAIGTPHIGNITSCCKGNIQSAYGYVWNYT